MPARAVSPHWPAHLPTHLTLPDTTLWHNVEVSAARYPDKPFALFYGAPLTYARLKDECERLAGWLQTRCGVQAGDRVLLYMQNSPQWIVAYYAILRANAVVVPVNPMNLTDELAHYVADSGATTVFVAQDLYGRVVPLLGGADDRPLRHAIVATYADYLNDAPQPVPPEFVRAPRAAVDGRGAVHWADALAARVAPGPHTARADDLAVMPYTSGTTGAPKGCMHTHRSVMSTSVGGVQWFAVSADATLLATLPFFHVTGMTGSLNGPLFAGATIVVLARWDRDAAADSIARYRVTGWQAISTMVVDFLAHPRIAACDLSSLKWIRGGGAAMPAAVAEKLLDLTGLAFIEGYGMSETMAATHLNPVHRPKPQCLGIALYDVDARIVDPDTLAELPDGEAGEIVIRAPQLMQGYWRNPDATRAAFVELDGRRFLRTGDLAHRDAEGYFFMTDRLKRMINAAGYKVWPAEVEALLYRHPAIHEVCVIGTRDARRGETVKAVVVLDERHADGVDAASIVAWARAQMAAYKVPRVIEFAPALPKSGSGKILWRVLQEAEDNACSRRPPSR